MSRSKKLLSAAIAVVMLACFVAGIAIADDSLCTIKINYLLSDGTKATSPWTTTVARGSNVSKTVKSPTIAGYQADKTTVDVSCANIQANMQYTVTYLPAETTFTVKHYKQNVAASGYDLFETTTETGITGSAVGTDIARDYAGFSAAPFDSDKTIAANGSTVVEVYYNRNYYLMSFNLDGGTGVEPLYARYGSEISVGTPTKAGYTFAGWSPELPSTMPAENTTVTASWASATDTVSVNVVIWGEQANSENYDFIKDLTLEVDSSAVLTPENFNSTLTCTIPEHTHTENCNCCQHNHTIACYGLSESDRMNADDMSDLINCFAATNNTGFIHAGSIYYYFDFGRFKNEESYYYCAGIENYKYVFYKFSDNSVAEKHVGVQTSERFDVEETGLGLDGKYDYYMEYSSVCTAHTHTAECYTCGLNEHTHTSDCYTASAYASKLNMDSKLWKFAKADVAKNADGTYVVNIYYDRVEYTIHLRKQTTQCNRIPTYDTHGSITAKWGADISTRFSKDGRIWDTNAQTDVRGGEEITYMKTMPSQDMILYAEQIPSKRTAYAYYYLENENGYDYATGYSYYRILNKPKEFSWFTYQILNGPFVRSDDLLEFEGFTLEADKSAKTGDNYMDACFYYSRNEYTLTFVGYGGETVKTEKVKYGCGISDYKDYVPEFPEGLDSDLYEFEGWYLTEQCYAGSKVDFSSQKMTLNGLKIYAHYVRKQLSVNLYISKDAMLSGAEPISTISGITPGSVTDQPIETPVNGENAFIGWYYTDENGTEHGFDFSMPIESNMNIYAGWTSGENVQYTVHYTLESGESIAEDTVGYALDLSTVTLSAKTGSDLNEGYTKGYLPQVGSYELSISANGVNEFTFVYTALSKVQFTTRYINKATGEELKEALTGEAVTRLNSSVTLEFDPIPGYVPDAYEKTIILSSDPEKNVVTFYYTADNDHAIVQITHYVQKSSGSGYDVYLTESVLAQRNAEYRAEYLTIDGFIYEEEKSTAEVGRLSLTGAELSLYYDRDTVEYTVKYVASDDPTEPGKVLWSETLSGLYGASVAATADAYTANNTYCLLETESAEKSITLGTDANSNEITFRYYPCYFVAHVREGEETTIETVRYCGTNATENLTELVSEGYLYGGAFTDESCTTPYGFGTGENGLVFKNTIGATYYVREVSESYLTPKTYAVSHKVNGEDTVYQLYLMSNTDSCKYQYAGFEIGGNYALSDALYGTVNVTKKGELYNQLYVKNGVICSSTTEVADRDEGYIAMYKLSDEEFEAFKEGNLEFKAFWVTLDGVLVTGTTSRNCTYIDASSKINVENTVTGSDLTWYTKADTQSVDLEDIYLLNSSDETAPVTPDTEEKTESDVPAAPEMTYTGEAKYLRVRHSYTMLTNSSRLISAVDLTDCAEAGFIVNGVTYKCESFAKTVSGYSARYLFGASVDGAMLMSIDLPLEGFSDGQKVNITPYIVTTDGTTVYGETCSATYRAWQGLMG